MTDDTPRQPEHCPTCGAAVRVANSDEGTNYYVRVSDDTTRPVEEVRYPPPPRRVRRVPRTPVEDTTRQAAERPSGPWEVAAYDAWEARRHEKAPWLSIPVIAEEAFHAGVAAERTRLLAELERLAVHYYEIADSYHYPSYHVAVEARMNAEKVQMVKEKLDQGWTCSFEAHTRCREMAERSETT